LDSAGTRTKKRQRPNKKTCSGLKLVCCKRFTREAYLVILCFLYGHTVERKLRDKERLNLVFFYSFIPFFIYLSVWGRGGGGRGCLVRGMPAGRPAPRLSVFVGDK
jgi:hypothetical protein